MRTFKEIKNNRNVKSFNRFYDGVRFHWNCDGLNFLVLATSDEEGDHVSISHADKSIFPTFAQMVKLRELCYRENEITHFFMKSGNQQFLVKNCYHIFRKRDEIVPKTNILITLKK